MVNMLTGRCTPDVEFYVRSQMLAGSVNLYADATVCLGVLSVAAQLLPCLAVGRRDGLHNAYRPSLQLRLCNRGHQRADHGPDQDAGIRGL